MNDVRTDVMTREQYDHNCFHHSQYAFAVPPDEFLFHHYDESPDRLLICRRPMAGIERYQVDDDHGGYYGLYDTKTVMWYITSKTWIVVDSGNFFIEAEIRRTERKLADLKSQLIGK